ncbi:hypothetical protein [Emticicia agri]|uniref:DUF4185 domain-containing protein n=1 Tax=Emticicia agri TaxID=2492393 RepID=A0A4Q5LYZ8_9BACT|nr:hypothetical protein [Emticicia agri]RYU95121.1 hypothetical protein EWM59_13820 [Emticicia agri]
MKKLLLSISAITTVVGSLLLNSCSTSQKEEAFNPKFKLTPAEKITFNSFVDCNMAEVWVGDTFRIFPGKYGEDPLWGYAKDLKYADGKNADEVFKSTKENFRSPIMPLNAPIGQEGLHGAVWFETVYQSPKDASGKTLYSVYHNENYPQTLPYDAKSGQGYKKDKWPQGLTGETSPAAVCRIGIMKSVDGGKSWENRGLFIEDLNPRMILKPHNSSNTFAGGVGDPSAVASGDYLYLFYGEYGYPGEYKEATYDAKTEWGGQCISIARIALADLDNPVGKAKRWDGNGFNAPHNGIGKPVSSLQIPIEQGGGPASAPVTGFHWGPSVSWNTYLNCWVMMMGKTEGKSWKGDKVYISFNKNADLTAGTNSQEWTKPQLVFDKPGYILWYPSLQPLNTEEDIKDKNTCLKLGKKARFFVKRIKPGDDSYASEHIIEFEK